MIEILGDWISKLNWKVWALNVSNNQWLCWNPNIDRFEISDFVEIIISAGEIVNESMNGWKKLMTNYVSEMTEQLELIRNIFLIHFNQNFL